MVRPAKAHASITGVQADIRFLNVRLKALAKTEHDVKKASVWLERDLVKAGRTS